VKDPLTEARFDHPRSPRPDEVVTGDPRVPGVWMRVSTLDAPGRVNSRDVTQLAGREIAPRQHSLGHRRETCPPHQGEPVYLHRSRWPLALAVALALTACSTEAPPPRTADAIVKGIAAKVPTARPGLIYTAGTDPNHLLGTPNTYTSKATFTDSRITTADIPDPQSDNLQAGGSVEVFADASDATIRQQQLRQLEKSPPLLGTEYTFTDGATLLRVSGKLTPTQAAEYQAALNS